MNHGGRISYRSSAKRYFANAVRLIASCLQSTARSCKLYNYCLPFLDDLLGKILLGRETAHVSSLLQLFHRSVVFINN